MSDTRGPVVRNSTKSQTHLAPRQREQLLAGYAAGVPVRELAVRFRVHRNTVTLVARRAGLPLRNEMVPEAVRNQALRLHEAGLSIDQAAARVGIGRETIRRAVRAAGNEHN